MVLGDVGRSPRMQYHALALADRCADVDLVGYSGSPAYSAVRQHASITCHLLRPPRLTRPQRLPRLLFLGYTGVKVIYRCFQVVGVLLFVIPKPDFILVQNPPAIPTLIVALLAARLRSAQLIIDWHNFGYAMLALTLGHGHPAVRLARWYERAVGRRADAHLCVSRAMQSELLAHWGIHATVLYDRPADLFAPTPSAVRRDLFRRLGDAASGYDPDMPARPALIISPTSWTADEDFALVLDAVSRCDARFGAGAAQASNHLRLLFLITGSGPLRADFEDRMRRLSLHAVELRTLWVPPEDYPLLLGAADLGLCLHRSASGLDLPMKVADMFGAGLPVCALEYGPCLAEQVRHGENGLLFSSAAELADQLYDLLKDFPEETPRLDQLRRNVVASRGVRWADEWRAEALRVFLARRRPEDQGEAGS